MKRTGKPIIRTPVSQRATTGVLVVWGKTATTRGALAFGVHAGSGSSRKPHVGREKKVHSVVHELPATPPHVAVGFVDGGHGVGSAGLKVNPGRPRTVALGDASAGDLPVRMSHRVVQSVREPPRVTRATLAVRLPRGSNVRVRATFLQADGIVAVLAGEVVKGLVLPATRNYNKPAGTLIN